MMYRIFGDSPTIKIVEWMIKNQEYDHSLKEIAKGAQLSTVVAKRNFEPLSKYGVVRANRTVGRDEMYVLDMENRCTKAIVEFDGKIAKCCESAADADDESEEDEYDEEYAPGLP